MLHKLTATDIGSRPRGSAAWPARSRATGANFPDDAERVAMNSRSGGDEAWSFRVTRTTPRLHHHWPRRPHPAADDRWPLLIYRWLP